MYNDNEVKRRNYMSQKDRFKAGFIYENDEIRAIRKKESKITRNIVRFFAILLAIIVIGGGAYGYYYISNALKPVDTKQTQTVEVEIPAGSSVKQISKILKEDFDYKLKKLLAILEPLVILILGLIVGFVVLAIYLPILSIGDIFI